MNLYKVQVKHFNKEENIYYFKNKQNAINKYSVIKEEIKRYMQPEDIIEKNTPGTFKVRIECCGVNDYIVYVKLRTISIDDLTED